MFCHLSTSEVQGRKPLSSCEGIQGLASSGQWVRIFMGFGTKLAIVYIESDVPSLLLHHHNWRRVGAATLPDNLTIHQLLNVSSHSLIPGVSYDMVGGLGLSSAVEFHV